MHYDYTIVGAGIVGLAIALNLRKKYPDAMIALIDKEANPGFHQSGHNSGVLHSGIYYTPGSLKAKNCIRGHHLMLEFCDRHSIPYSICGKLIVATRQEELPYLEKIYNNGTENGLKDLEFYDHQQIIAREPNISGIRAIFVPQAGIVDYHMVTECMRKELEESGVDFHFETSVSNIEESDDEVTITTNMQPIYCKQLITAAGLYADKLASMSGHKLDCQIVPFRGEYYQFTQESKNLVNHLVYPVPDPAFPFLGVHFTPTIHGELEAGPNAVLAFAREGYTLSKINWGELFEILRYKGFQKLAFKHFSKGLGEMKRSISKLAFVKALSELMPGIKPEYLVPSPAGVRAQALLRDGELMHDYYIERSNRILHLINAPSPAATSSLSIGEYIVNLIEESV